jgi:hypothetical protein
MKLKFTWGTGAFMLFGSFAVFMTCLAVFASMQRNELVTEDYYEKELEFEVIQKKQQRTSLLSTQTELKIENGQFIINFPEEIEGEISGNLVFFKPSNQSDDKSIDFKAAFGKYKLAVGDFSTGMDEVQVNWSANGVEFYNEGEIVIP